jgi:cell division protein FtsB
MSVPARTKYIFLTILFVLAAINFTRTAMEIIDNSKRLEDLSQEVNQMEGQKNDLQSSVEYKKTDDYVEEKARDDLNMVKPGEKVYVIPKELGELNLESSVLGKKTLAGNLSARNPEDESNIMRWVKLFTERTGRTIL